VCKTLLFDSDLSYEVYYDNYLLTEVFEEINTIPSDRFYYPIPYIRVELNNVVKEHFNLPNNILSKIKEGQCKLLIQNTSEGWTYSTTFDPFIQYIVEKYDLKDSDIVILSGNRLKHERFKSIYHNKWEMEILSHWNSQTPNSIYKNRSFKYICLNRRPDLHRVAIATLLSQLKEPGILTLARNGGYGDSFLHNSEQDLIKRFPELKETYDNNIKPYIPLTYNDGIDPEEFNPNFDNKVEKFYNSYLHVVTETNFNSTQLFLSEKIFKPIIHFQPFVVLGNPGTLGLLKDLGYKTFSEYIDETYDVEKDVKLRTYKVFTAVENFINKSPKHLTELIISMKPIFEHNLNNLRKRALGGAYKEVKFKLYEILNNY
jgi:hypothetical protein